MPLAGLADAAEGSTAHLREASFFCTMTVNAATCEALVLGL